MNEVYEYKSVSLEELTKIVEDIIGEAANEKSTNVRKKRSNNRS